MAKKFIEIPTDELIPGEVYADLGEEIGMTSYLEFLRLEGEEAIFKYHSGFKSYEESEESEELSFRVSTDFYAVIEE